MSWDFGKGSDKRAQTLGALTRGRRAHAQGQRIGHLTEGRPLHEPNAQGMGHPRCTQNDEASTMQATGTLLPILLQRLHVPAARLQAHP
jgi:hypothetical protein